MKWWIKEIDLGDGRVAFVGSYAEPREGARKFKTRRERDEALRELGRQGCIVERCYVEART